MTMRLVSSGMNSLELQRYAGVVAASYEKTFPEVRAVTERRPDAHGERDTTQFLGASLVTVELTLIPDRSTKQALLDSILAFFKPGRTTYLHTDPENSGTERRIRVRMDSFSGPLTSPTHRRVQLNWRAPDGVEEAADLSSETASAVAVGEGGRTYDRTYNRTYTAANPVGTVVATNGGTADVYPTILLYGPATNPKIENQTTDQRLSFDGLTLTADDVMTLDFKERTALLNGESQLQYLDFAASDWFVLEPGDNTLRFYPDSFSAPAQAVIEWRDAWL